jgi:hypothetical protein
LTRFLISIGEPWDFDGPDGPNRLYGTYDPSIPASSGSLIVLRTTTHKYDQTEFDAVELSHRYDSNKVGLGELLTGKGQAVNGSFGRMDGTKFLPSGAHHFIGSVRLASADILHGGQAPE